MQKVMSILLTEEMNIHTSLIEISTSIQKIQKKHIYLNKNTSPGTCPIPIITSPKKHLCYRSSRSLKH